MFCKKAVLVETHLCWSLFLDFIKTETSTKVFSCKFGKIFKNTFLQSLWRIFSIDHFEDCNSKVRMKLDFHDYFEN